MVSGNFSHVIESDDVAVVVVDDDDDEFRFTDALIHAGHLHQNGILTWFGFETAKKRKHTIKS